MIISDEQVRLAAQYLRTSDAYGDPPRQARDSSDPQLIDRIVHTVEGLPDVREDRVAQARESVSSGIPDAETVASKLIGRVLSDSVR